MLDLVSQYGARFYDTTMQAAATAGNLEMCQYLHKEGCKWCALSMLAADAGGHTDVLRWLQELLQPDVLRWLQERGCRDNIRSVNAFMHGV
jgi:hypothetical protein